MTPFLEARDGYVVHEATADDVHYLVLLCQDAAELTGPVGGIDFDAASAAESIAATIDWPNSDVLVLRRDGRIKAMIAVQLLTAWINRNHRFAQGFGLRVQPYARRQGFGLAMLEAAIRWAQRKQANAFRMAVDSYDGADEIMRLFSRAGLSPAEKGYAMTFSKE